MTGRNTAQCLLALTVLLSGIQAPLQAHPEDDCGKQAAQKPYRELIFNTIINPYLLNDHTTFLDMIFNPLFAELRKHTGGSIEPKYYLPFELSPITEVYNSVVSGSVDMGFSIMMDSDQDDFPVTTLLRIPRVDQFTYQPALVTWRMLQDFPEMKQEWENVKVLFLYGENNGGIATTEKPVHNLADLEGLRLICFTELAAKQAQALGAVPVVEKTSIEAMFKLLESGAVDGMVYDLPGFLVGYGFARHLRHTTDLRLAPASLYTVMNKDVWSSLSERERQAIDTVFDVDAYTLADNAMKAMDADYYRRLEEEFGITRTRLPAAEKTRAARLLQPLREEYAGYLDGKGFDGKDLVQRFDRLYREYAELPSSSSPDQ